jgi:hypothetical protein
MCPEDGSREDEVPPIRRVERFLDRLFAAGAFGELEPGAVVPAAGPAEGAAAPVQRALLSVDDAGDYLLCAGRELSLGHARAGLADLPVLADVGPLHARFHLRSSFGSGESWCLEPVARERVYRNAEPLQAAAALADGDDLRLGKNLELVFQAPDPASATAVLALGRGADCLGASHVVLFAAGAGGRLRLGAAAGRHVRVPNLIVGADLMLFQRRLWIASEAGVAVAGSASAETLGMPFPPDARVDVRIGKGEHGRAPFSFSLLPL